MGIARVGVSWMAIFAVTGLASAAGVATRPFLSQFGRADDPDTHLGEIMSFVHNLDHDADGDIRAFEAAASLGVGTGARKWTTEWLERSTTEGDDALPVDIPPYPFHPSLFADRLVYRTRHKLLSGSIAMDERIDALAEIQAYLQAYQCDDVLPPEWAGSPLTCGERVPSHSPDDACEKLLSQGFCRFTCYACSSSRNNKNGNTKESKPKKSAASDHVASPSLLLEKQQQEQQQQQQDHALSYENTQELTLLVSSDWHSAPWYQMDGKGMPAGSSVTRFRNCTYDNMWSCFDHDGNQAQCRVTGINDPPRAFVTTHLQAFSEKRQKRSPDSPFAFLFIGDTQVHDLNAEYLNGMDPAVVVRDIINATLADVRRHFSPEQIFYTAGNNDGPHNHIFAHGKGHDNETDFWAQALVAHGIVTNDLGWTYSSSSSSVEDGGREERTSPRRPSPLFSQVELFQETGYYVKQISNFSGPTECGLFVMITNTNLGTSNTLQNNAIRTDLARVEDCGGYVYFLGHHPMVTPLLVPTKYTPLIRGMLSGHIHKAYSTFKDGGLWFTQVGAISQDAFDTGFYVGRVGEKTDFRLNLNYDDDLYIYTDEPGNAPNASLWELRPSGGGKGGGEENHHMMTILVVSASIFTVVVIGAVVTALCFRSRSPLWYNPVPAVGVNVVELEGNNENPPPSHSADGDKAIRAGDATSSIHKINDSMMEARSHHELQTAL